MLGYNCEEVLPIKNVLAIENPCALGKSELSEDVLRSPASRFGKCDSVTLGGPVFNRAKHKLLPNTLSCDTIGNAKEI